MATKSKGRRTPSVTPAPGTSTPVQARPNSPLSPTRHSRLQEKAELQCLNDRLAIYIDRVRNLENENARLTIEIQTTRDTIKRETSNIKSMYEHELSDARKLLDETAREKAKLEIDTKRLFEEKDELKERLEKKQKELLIAENSARVYESRCTELTGKYNSACADRKKAVEEAKELEKENDRLRKLLEDLRKHLENETLARVDLENTVQSLREELTFKDQIHSQELNETRTRRQVEINEIDGRLSEKYEAKLQQSLQELREQYEAQMRANRDEIEMLYSAKMKNLQNAASRNSNAAASAIEELRITRSQIDGLNSRIGELEATNSALHARIRDLEKLLEVERARHADDIALLESELSRLREEMAQQLQEYQDLMDIKVSLDLEIAAYDKLLKGEEHRLNITPTSNTSATISSFSHSLRSGRATSVGPSPSNRAQPASKRKRTMVDESEDRSISDYYVTGSAKGEIEIIEADPEGRFVKLYNKGKKEMNIGGWQLIRSAGNNETVFKFHRSVKIDSGANVTVWSSDTGVNHEPPTNIVMKQQKWFTGDNMKTILLNSDGEEVAASERIKQQISTHASRHRSSAGFYSGNVENENIFHQQVRASPATNNTSSSSGGEQRPEEKCHIM